MQTSINIGGNLLDLSIPKVMGIINITPDSFYSGSRTPSADLIASRVQQMIDEGADIIDVGGYSSRPGGEDVSMEIEMERVSIALEVIRNIDKDIVLSIDTFRADVAKMAFESWNVNIINDISGGTFEPGIVDFVAEARLPYIIMHMQGNPSDMQLAPAYDSVVHNIIKWFSERIKVLTDRGVCDIIIDPGFGFGKTIDHNYSLLANLQLFKILEQPIMVGLSRKSMIWKTLDITPEEALAGTIVLNSCALIKGVSILRVHDVKEAVQAVKLIQRLNNDNALE